MADDFKLRSKWSYGNKREFSIADAVSYDLDGNDYDAGAVETAARTARNTAEFVGKLTQALYESGVLSKDEIEALLPGWERV